MCLTYMGAENDRQSAKFNWDIGKRAKGNYFNGVPDATNQLAPNLNRYHYDCLPNASATMERREVIA